MKKTFFNLIILFSCFSVFAQQGSVEGNLQDASSKTPIAYASATLMRAKDTTLVQGAMTDKDGRFSIQNIAPGNYLVKIFFVGYPVWYSSELKIDHKKIDLGVIELSISAQALKAAEVVYVKPLFEEKSGKTIMNVESHPTAAGDNVLELLRKMPTVTVDHKDNISIKGKSGVTILIDDKRTYLSGDDLVNLLKGMPASSVDQIEVIKNPSARYDAEGTAGIINIVTKKNLSRGINGSVFTSGGYSGAAHINTGFNLNARLNKWILTAGYNYNIYQGKHGSKSENITPTENYINRMTTNEKGNELWSEKNNWQGHNINLGADYSIDDNNIIGMSYRGNFSLYKSNGNQYTRIYNNNVLDSSFCTNSQKKGNGYNNTINFDYKHKFDTTGKVLTMNIAYSRNDRENIGRDSVAYYSGEFSSLNRYNTLKSTMKPGVMQVATAKIDYEHPFSTELKLEMGVKSSLAFNNNENQNFVNDVLNNKQSNHFIYKENIDAAYLMLDATPSELISIQTGLRAELTYLQGLLVSTGEKNKQLYCNLFPSLEIDFQLPKQNTLSFSYRNRIYRPSYNSLNPFIYVEPYEITTGNPNLKPQFSQDLEINYSWHYILFITLQYNYAMNTTESMLFTDIESKTRLVRPENIGKGHSLGASIYARIPIGNWWVMSYSINGSIGQNAFDYGTHKVIKNIYDAQFYTSQAFTFLKNYTIEVSAWGVPKQEMNFGSTSGNIYVSAGFKANILKNTLTIGLTVNDIFNNGHWKEYNRYPDGTVMNGEWYWPSRGVYANISYRFGKQNIQPRVKESQNEEINRMSGGGGGNGGGSTPGGGKTN